GAIRILGLERFALPTEREMDHLRAVGLPTDLLAFFFDEEHGDKAAAAARVVSEIAARLTTTPALDSTDFRFSFRQTIAGFRASLNTGDTVTNAPANHFRAIRLQQTRGGHYLGAGSGDNLDFTLQLLAHLPDTPFIIHVERQHLQQFLQQLG